MAQPPMAWLVALMTSVGASFTCGVTPRAAAEADKCLPIMETYHYNFDKIAGKYWYLMWVTATPKRKCLLMMYDLPNKEVRWLEKESQNGGLLNLEQQPFKTSPYAHYIGRNYEILQQVLATDNQTWILVRYCNRQEGVSRWIIAFDNPKKEFTVQLKHKIQDGLDRWNIKRQLFRSTRCSGDGEFKPTEIRL